MGLPKHIKEHSALNIDDFLNNVYYQGTWNADTNTPTLTSGVGNQGWYYVVSVRGDTLIDGEDDWKVKDWIIFNGVTWEKVDNTDEESYQVLNSNGNISFDTTEVIGGTLFNLPPIGNLGKKYRIINSSDAKITISSTEGIGNKVIGNNLTLDLKSEEWLDVIDNGTLWRII